MQNLVNRNVGHWGWSVRRLLTSALFLTAGQVTAQDAFANIGQGIDNTQFTYTVYQDDTAAVPALVADAAALNQNAIRLGPITESTASQSRETGFLFDPPTAGTLTLSWRVNSQPFSAGVGALLWWQVFDPLGGSACPYSNNFISGVQSSYADTTIAIPSANCRVLISYLRTATSVPQNGDSGFVDNLRWVPEGGVEPPPPIDTTPDAFVFVGQVGVARSTPVQSNTITVSGINAATPISITGCSGTACSYSVNGSAFTAVAGSVNNGDQVVVRQTSLADFSSTGVLTLNIGGVAGSFAVTTLDPPEPVTVITGTTPTGSGTVIATAVFSDTAGAECAFSDAALLNAPVAPPAGVELPHGLLGFTASGCSSNFSVTVTVQYPDPIPAGSSYYKYTESTGWFTIPATISGNTVTFTITDNGLGDANSTLGIITDPGGIGVVSSEPPAPRPVEPIPTLSEWLLMLLAGCIGLLGLTRLRRPLAA